MAPLLALPVTALSILVATKVAQNGRIGHPPPRISKLEDVLTLKSKADFVAAWRAGSVPKSHLGLEKCNQITTFHFPNCALTQMVRNQPTFRHLRSERTCFQMQMRPSSILLGRRQRLQRTAISRCSTMQLLRQPNFDRF